MVHNLLKPLRIPQGYLRAPAADDIEPISRIALANNHIAARKMSQRQTLADRTQLLASEIGKEGRAFQKPCDILPSLRQLLG